MYEHQTRGEQDISEENQQVTREEIRNLRQTAEEHRVARDEAGDNTEKLRLIHEPLNKILQERKGHIAKLEELEENEKKRSDEMAQLKAIHDAAVIASMMQNRKVRRRKTSLI